MATPREHIRFTTTLQTTTAPEVSLNTQLFLVDDEQIPIDLRYLFYTQDSYKTDLTSGTVPYDYAEDYFGQAIKAPRLMIGRWAKAATNPSFVCGPGYERDYAVWAAITDAEFAVTDGTNTDNIGPLTFAGVTVLSQVIAILDAGLAAVGAPNITGLNTFAFSFDSTGRLVLTSSQPGAAAATITITAHTAPTGTEISETLMDAANGTSVAGLDAEEPTDALDAISAIDDSYYNVQLRGEDDAQQLALAAYIETSQKLLDIWTADPNAKSAAAETDIGYLVKTLGYKRTCCIYSERTTEYGDAAAAGRFLPAKAGSTSFSWNPLSGVSESGLAAPLTATEKIALNDKNYNYFQAFSTATILYPGWSASKVEKRLLLGRDWFDARNIADTWTFKINAPKTTYSNVDIGTVEGIVRTNAAEAVSRGIIVDTIDRPFTTNFPDADTITPAERATHQLTITDAYNGYLDSEWVDVEISGDFVL